MRPNALRRPDSRESATAAKSRLAMLLAGATDKALAAFTADSLVATHRVRFADAAVMLAEARGRRGA